MGPGLSLRFACRGRSREPAHSSHYRRALLFTGHMVDLPTRLQPRFPPYMEAAASHEIAAAMDRGLERVDAAEVIAISSLARGGDILFQEHAAARRLASYIVLPFEPEVFLQKSVSGVPTGDWEARFQRIWNRTPRDQREVMAASADGNPYEACNQRQLEIARRSADDLVLIALFDGTADGAGGTQDLIARARAAGGRVDVIDTQSASCAQCEDAALNTTTSRACSPARISACSMPS